MNRVLVLVQNGVRQLTAPSNTTTKKGRRQTKPITVVTNPTCEVKLAPRYEHLTEDEILEIELAEQAYRDRIVSLVNRFGYCPRRGQQVQAAGEFEAMLRVVSAKFGGTSHDKDACESRSHELSKDRKRRLRRLSHPRNAALLAA